MVRIITLSNTIGKDDGDPIANQTKQMMVLISIVAGPSAIILLRGGETQVFDNPGTSTTITPGVLYYFSLGPRLEPDMLSSMIV